MAKKRPNQDSAKSTAPVKKPKASEAEFNGTVFKSMLKETATAMKGLETFISTAKKLPCVDLYDVVEGYIKISVECAEIFKLLEGDSHVESEMMLVFQSLEMILLRTASDLSHFSMVGSTIVKKTVSSHMKLLQTSLHSKNHRFVRQCLSFLSAMVSQGPDAARDVFSHMHFGKGLSGLARRRDKMGRPDVRMAYIQFAVSFLVSGDNATIGQLLEMKDFLTDILNTGLKEDRISIINLILSTLQTKVVQSKGISKTQKVRFFSPAILAQIATLYRWNGIVDARTGDCKKAGNYEDEGKLIVRELAHNFLLDLCCSRKHGISFHDPSFGTAGRAGNIVLLQFLVGLKQVMEDQLLAELVVSILKGSPDVLPRYFKETQYSFTPRLKSAWQDNVTLLKKIYEAQPEVSKAFRTREVIPLPRLLAMVTVTSLPPVCNKAFFTQGLNFSNTVVQHTTLSMVAFILRRAHKNMEHCLDRSVWQSSDIYSPATMEDFVQLYREALSKVLPDMTIIVSKWQSLTKKEKGEEDGKKGKTEANAQGEETKTEEHGLDDPKVILLKALILQVMCLYQKVVPHLVSQSKFDFSKLLKGIVSEKGVKEEVPPVLQHQILQLALDLPASKFSWFRVQDIADAEAAGGEKSVFYLLLKMFVSSNSSHLKTSTRMLVLKVLKDSGVFEHTWKELDLWLNHLACLESSQQETVIQFLDRVLVRLVCNAHTYTDKAASLVQEAAYLQANLSGQDGDAASIPISHIDDVLDMVDIIMEGSEGDIEQLGPALTDDLILQTFPFSAIVPAVLEARNKLPATFKVEKGVVYEYLAAVLCDVLHSQRDPLALCLALLQYDKELDPSGEAGTPHPSVIHLHHYYSRWLPQQSQETLFKTSESSSDGSPAAVGFTALMKAAYSAGPAALLQPSFKQSVDEALATLDVSGFPVAVNQVLLYIKSTVDTFSTLPKDSAVPALSSLMGVLQALVVKLQSSEEATEPVPVDPQEGAELFLDTNPVSWGEANKDQVLLSVLGSIFKHPSLEQWFLALELGALPSHSLNPVRLKGLCARLGDATLSLLRSSAPALRDLDALPLISSYLSAVQRAVLRELAEARGRCPLKESLPVQGLLSLHEFMDLPVLKEVASALLLLPQESLVAAGDGAPAPELGAYGRAALRVLTEGAGRRDGALALSRAHLHGLAALLASCRSAALEAFLLRALGAEPGGAKLVGPEVLLHCLQGRGAASPAVGALLLQNCSAHRLRFELWCLEPANLAQSAGSEAFLGLLRTYLRTATAQDHARPREVQTAALRALKKALLAKLWSSMLEGEVGETLTQQVDILSSLIKLAAKPTDIVELANDLPVILQKSDSFERWQLADAISAKLADSPDELESWRKSLLSAALHWLISSYSSCKEHTSAPLKQEEAMLHRLQALLIFPENVTPSDWNSFVKAGLKYRYRDPDFLGTLGSLLDLMYGGAGAPKDLVPLPTIHMMTSSHSLFLPSMLASEEELSAGPQSKEALVSLLLTLVKKCPAVCDRNHFLVLLGAYGATLSTTDQKLVLLMQEYERNGISLVEFQSLLWGPAAVDHHKARKSLGPSLWQQPSSEELLALLNADTMLNTVARFPQQRRIVPQDGKELIYREDGDRVQDLGTLYDPCFLLPLFSAILRPESVIDCLTFVSSHALGVTVVALSSYDPKLRAAAYQVLGSYYHHLEGARFREKRQLLYLLDTVKNGIRQQNLRLPFVLTTYVAKVAQQMLRPEEHMYMVVNKFLLGHQYLDFKRVPEFFKLFYSFDMEHKVEREWVLSVLEEGVTDRHCYELCDQQGIYHTLLGFCSSPLCEGSTRIQIVNVLRQTARVTKAAYNLTKVHGVLTWVLQVVEKRYLDGKLLCALINLLHTLWFTNLGQKENKAEEKTSTAEDKPQGPIKCLPLPLINEFLCVLSTIIRHLKTGVKAPQLMSFLQILASVLRHRGTALGVHAEAGWLTLRPQAVSSTEALSLLHRWSTLAHDASVLSALQGLATTHQGKRLLGTGKEKGRGRGSLQQARSRVDEQSDAADGDSEKREQSALEECKPLLRNIFTHWEPAPALPCPSTEPQHDPDISKGDASSVANATAQLLVKWTLKTLASGPYDDGSTVSFLKWIQTIVVAHKGIVETLLADAAVKLDFLRLYHQACECSPQDQSSSGLETIQLFTSIMVQLLEAQGVPPGDLHQTVLNACLSLTTDCDSRREAGLMLLSLYIHELWSGAESPELFLTHVRLVSRDRGKGPKKTKGTATKTAVTHICRDILSAMDSFMSS